MEPRFEVLTGDITCFSADAIVNASDSRLSGGGGVDAAIQQAGGPALMAACRAAGGCAPGEIQVTPGFQLPAKWVFHTVGPVWQGGSAGEAAILASCYRSCLARAEEMQLESLAFSSISTGVFGYPVFAAATVAEKAIMEFLREHDFPRRVSMICHREETAQVYRQVYNLWYAGEKSQRM